MLAIEIDNKWVPISGYTDFFIDKSEKVPWTVNNIFTLCSWDYPIKLPNGFPYSVEVE